MFRIAIVGCGPTAVFTLRSLIDCSSPLAITIFERTGSAGVGMPYRQGANDSALLANIASVELPPVLESLETWLCSQSNLYVERMGVDMKKFDERTFLPRVVLGAYFKDQFARVVELGAERGHEINVLIQHNVTDIQLADDLISVAAEEVQGLEIKNEFERVIIATGHEGGEDEDESDTYFSSPYPTWRLRRITASHVGILGTSLSGIDAAVSIAQQNGVFHEKAPELVYSVLPQSRKLKLTMMSRNGLLPEADFYCPIPYEPLEIFTLDAVEAEVHAGEAGLLDRLFKLFRCQVTACDPEYARTVCLEEATADTYPETYFALRSRTDPIESARVNLATTDADRINKRTVAWKYAILRMHEVFEHAVKHLGSDDKKRFHDGMKRMFVDNYAAVPPESVRRLLALHDADILKIVALGPNYEVRHEDLHTVISDDTYRVDVFVDATGETAESVDELPFPGIKEAFSKLFKKRTKRFDPQALPKHGGIYLAALPYLLVERPFVQGLVSCHEIGSFIAKEINKDVKTSNAA